MVHSVARFLRTASQLMQRLLDLKSIVIAFIGLALGIGGISTAWHVKCEPTPEINYTPYAIKTDGTSDSHYSQLF